MKKLYCVICSKYRKLEKLKISYLLEKIFLSVLLSKSKNEDEKIYKQEESINEILKILGSINDIEEYQKIKNHA